MGDSGTISDFLAGGGEMGALTRAHDWSKTSLAHPETWPQSLRVTVRLVLTSRHPMFIWWGPELIQFYNDAYRETMGPERHPSALGARGRECWDEIWDVIGPQIEYVMAGNGATWNEDQLVPVTRHGRREDVWWTYSFGPIDCDGKVGGVLVVCRDVTSEHMVRETLRLINAELTHHVKNTLTVLGAERERRSYAEAESRQRMTELAHVNRYSTAGELTAAIAHEINQPLGSILVNTASAELILSSPSPNLNVLKEILSDIRRDDQRATEVIRRLHGLLKKAPSEARPIDLNEPVREAIGLLRPTAKGLKIEILPELSPTPLQVNADTIQIQQVVMNLARNGFDAISEHSTTNRKIVVSTGHDGKMAVVSVSDTGGGLSVDNPERVFDPFFSTKKGGMGMGLAIVRMIVAAHDGSTTVENGQGGATFRVYLPLVENEKKEWPSYKR
jgi:signal transduction histidine kinase